MQIVKEGYPFIVTFIVVGIAFLILDLGRFTTFAGVLCIFISLFCLYFFRDPKVMIVRGDNLILSPCNGTVLEIGETATEKVIRVFLSVLDVHLQRSPVSGKVISVKYEKGKFLKANKPQAHIVNEQNIITIENEKGRYIVKQIAGLIARRCVSWVKEGDILEAGDKIGVIKFGSQVDLCIPKSTDVNVKVKKGDKVVAGSTIFAELQPVK